MSEKTKVGGIIQNDHLATISVLAVEDRPGIAAAILDALGRRNLNVQFIVQVIDHAAQDHLVLCVDRADLPACLAIIEGLRTDLQPPHGDLGTPPFRVRPATVNSNPEVASLAIFGPDFRERPGIAGRMFRALADRGINILAISTSISTVNCIIDSARLKDAVAAVEDYFDLP